MATNEELQAQLTKVRQEMAKLMELLDTLAAPKVPQTKKNTKK